MVQLTINEPKKIETCEKFQGESQRMYTGIVEYYIEICISYLSKYLSVDYFFSSFSTGYIKRL